MSDQSRRWPYLQLIAGNLYEIDPSADYHAVDVAHMDRQEQQLRDWIGSVAGEAKISDFDWLRPRVGAIRIDRYDEPADAAGRKCWWSIYYVFAKEHVLVEEDFCDPLPEDLVQSSPPAHMRRFKRIGYDACPDEVKRRILKPMGK